MEAVTHVSCMLFGCGGVILTVKFWIAGRLASLLQSVDLYLRLGVHTTWRSSSTYCAKKVAAAELHFHTEDCTLSARALYFPIARLSFAGFGSFFCPRGDSAP